MQMFLPVVYLYLFACFHGYFLICGFWLKNNATKCFVNIWKGGSLVFCYLNGLIYLLFIMMIKLLYPLVDLILDQVILLLHG